MTWAETTRFIPLECKAAVPGLASQGCSSNTLRVPANTLKYGADLSSILGIFFASKKFTSNTHNKQLSHFHRKVDKSINRDCVQIAQLCRLLGQKVKVSDLARDLQPYRYTDITNHA